jgi:hypothetical protein
MLDRAFLRPILNDESLTRGLGDEEARVLIEWLADRAEAIALAAGTREENLSRLTQLCKQARVVARFVRLWCHEGECGAAVQLAGATNAEWGLPRGEEDPVDLLARLLDAGFSGELAMA